MTASVLDPSSTPYKATNDLLTINLNEWFYNCISCNRNVDISFSFGDTTLKIANFCRFYHSKYRPMTKAISWGGGRNPKHFNSYDNCKHLKQWILVTILVIFSQSSYCKGILINVNGRSQENRGTLKNVKLKKKNPTFNPLISKKGWMYLYILRSKIVLPTMVCVQDSTILRKCIKQNCVQPAKGKSFSQLQYVERQWKS